MNSKSGKRHLPLIIPIVIWGIAVAGLALSDDWSYIFQESSVSLIGLFIFGITLIGFAGFESSWQLQPEPQQTHPSGDLQSLALRMLGVILPLALFWNTYHHVLNNWWMFDDADILHYVDVVGAVDGFYVPNLKYNFYTPLQHFSLGIDYSLFALEPAGFYWHHLLSLSLVIVLAYAVLRQFFAPIYGSMILSLFVISMPMVQVSNWLMVRHYVEGLLFSLISILLFIFALRRDSLKMAVAGSFCYLVATLAKEIYVPLIVVLLWLPISSLQARFKLCIPYAIAAAFYALARIYMLGDDLLSAYGQQGSTFSDFIALPFNVTKNMGWGHWWQYFIVSGIICGFFLAVLGNPKKYLTGIAIWTAVIFLPLVPIVWRLSFFAYYLILVSLLASILFGISLRYLADKFADPAWRNVFVPVTFLALLLVNLQPAQEEQSRIMTSMKAEQLQAGKILEHQDPATVIIYDSYVADDFVHLRQRNAASLGQINWCPRNDCLCAQHYSGLSALVFDGSDWIENDMANVSCGIDPEGRAFSASFVITMPNTLSWDFGPYSATEGTYFIAASRDEFGQQLSVPRVLTVPPQGQFDRCCGPFEESFTWTVNFKSHEGWELISDPILLDPVAVSENGTAEIHWQRN